MVVQGSEWAQAGAVLVGLPDFEVLASGEVGGEIELLVQLRARVEGCPKCGVVAKPKGRRAVLVRDLPARGRPVTLVWSKRLWRCAEQQCPMGSWSQTHPPDRAAGGADRTGPAVGVRTGRPGQTVDGGGGR